MPGFTRLAAIFCFILSFHELSAQTNCVNYDSRYPLTGANGRMYYWNPVWNFPTLRQKKISNLNIGGNGMWRGLLEYLPAGYTLAANSTKKYPVIIYFHGSASKGFGSALELCRLFKDRGADSATYKALPGRIERNNSVFTQTFAGIKYEYIVISPQFTEYTRLQPGVPDRFPSAKDVEAVINYVAAKYRIDTRRIYLTGYSTGANMIIEYAGSSVARAKRVAAIMPVSLCSQLSHPNNKGIYAKNIGLAKLKTWFVYCEDDNCGGGSAILRVSDKWVDSIRKVPGMYPPRYTRLRNINPPTLYNCSDSLYHDSWSRAYDPNFRTSFNFTTSNSLINDGINLNIYEWFARQVNPAAAAVAPASIQLAPGEGLTVESRSRQVIISPNPVVSQLNAFVSLDKPGKLTMTLCDLTGKQLESVSGLYGKGTTQVRFNSAGLPAGIYFLRISGDDINITQKVLKK
jgi:predicted esterase